MKKTKLLSLLLCLSLVCTLFVSGMTAYAEGESNPGDGMKINKTATVNASGTTTITLEAFATGNKIITTETKDVPTDIILVIDQSGSMDDEIGTVTYTQYSGNDTQNRKNYENRHNGGDGNLWHKLPDDSYVSVSVTKTTTYNALSTELPNYKYNGECYWKYANNLYERVGDEYKKVFLTYEYGDWLEDNTYIYTFPNGDIIRSKGDSSVPELGTHTPLYTPAADGNNTVYTYTYTDNKGAVQTIGTSTGANTQFTPAFYKRTVSASGGGSRLAAIQTAVTNFANTVTAKAKGTDGQYGTTDDINHRIAVVGFAGCQNNSPSYVNTEIFIGATQYGYGQSASSVYATAFQEMDTAQGLANVLASAGALSAEGSTYVDKGIDLANGIFNSNPVGDNEKRNRVVIVFTDGAPGWNGTYNGNNYGYSGDAAAAADAALTAISTTKNTHQATVYTVGIFSGADATTAGSNANGASAAQRANWFMQNLSSNNGTPRTPSYYLSAGDSASLNNIFQQISSNIQTGGSGTTLGSDAVVKDIISPYFTLPEGTTATAIRLDTYACTGKDGDTYTWSSASSGNGGAFATVDGNKVSVTGFNFSENWCGTETDANNNITVRGKKLVISFDVKPKDGFLGGNGVPTNGSDSGVYDKDGNEVKKFDVPTVNVPIKDVTVTAEDKNVYLLGNVTEDQLKNGATAKCGSVPLNLNETNYGLESWQTKFVEITTTVTDKDGNAIPTTGLKDLTADGTYTISVKVAPKPGSTTSAEGTPATEKNGTITKNINVFKPELTFKDTEAYYGDTVPAKLESNLTNTEWKHGETVADPATMLGNKPTLDITCTPDASKILNGTINTTEDIGVAVTVKIDNTNVTTHTTFKHEKCANQNCTVLSDYQFLIHVKTCTLKITKKVSGTAIDDGQSFIFQITGPGIVDTKTVVIKGNGSVTLKGLKVGEYTVEETGWSWRYTPQKGTQTITLDPTQDAAHNTVTFVNARTNNKWVSTDAYSKNEFAPEKLIVNN